MKIILTAIIIISAVTFGPGNGQKTDSVTIPQSAGNSLSTTGTKALVAEIGAGKKQIAENLEYFKWLANQKAIDAKRIVELEQKLAQSRAAEAWAKSHPDTIPVYLQPIYQYQVSKVIFATDPKDGGKKKTKGSKVAYDTSIFPTISYTVAKNP